jgi:hypothetical protein
MKNTFHGNNVIPIEWVTPRSVWDERA